MDYETHKAIEDAQQTLADLSESLDLEGRKNASPRSTRSFRHRISGTIRKVAGHHAGKEAP